MPVTFKEADNFLIEMAQELINEHHPWLREARVGFMYRSEAIEDGRHMTIGHARKVSAEMQVFMEFDFLIWIAEDVFASFSPEQRRALVDHELCHCRGFDGEWKIRKHDFEEFHEIIARYGLWSETLKTVGQTLAQPELPNVKVEIQRHSGMVSSVPAELLIRAASNSEEFAAELVAEARKLAEQNDGEMSASLLQRKFRISYPKARSLIELIRTAEGKVQE